MGYVNSLEGIPYGSWFSEISNKPPTSFTPHTRPPTMLMEFLGGVSFSLQEFGYVVINRMVNRCPNLSRMKYVGLFSCSLFQMASFKFVVFFIFVSACVFLFFLFPCFNPSQELALSENDQKKTDNTHHSLILMRCFCF